MFADMSRMLLVSICGAGLAAGAADGVWTNLAASATWSTTTNWKDGIVAGDGGIATFTNSVNTTISGVDGVTLGGMIGHLGAVSTTFQGTGLTFTENAVIDNQTPFAENSFYFNLPLTCAGDLVFTGTSRSHLLASNPNLAGRIIVRDGGIRAKTDASLGPTQSSYKADTVILDNGTLENNDGNSTLTIPANRGITVTARGGYLGASCVNGGLRVNSPIVGEGSLGINYQNCWTYLTNPTNDWRGDTLVGAEGPCAAQIFGYLALEADEVIPHGEGRGILKVGPYTGYASDAEYLTRRLRRQCYLDLKGHTETVNGLYVGALGYLRSSVAGGQLILAGDGDSEMNGTLESGTLVKRGAGRLSITGGHLASAVRLEAGEILLSAVSHLHAGVPLTLAGGKLILTNPSGVGVSINGDEPRNWGWPTVLRAKISNTATYTFHAKWYLAEAKTISVAKSFAGTITLAIDGTTLIAADAADFQVVQDVALAAGWHDVVITAANPQNRDYSSTLLAGLVYDAENGAFETDEEKNRAHMFTADNDPTYRAVLDSCTFVGTLVAEADSTITCDEFCSPVIFTGALKTDADDPHTLTFNLGRALVIGSTDVAAPAYVGAPLASTTGGIVYTNNVWLTYAPGADATIADDALPVYAYADALANDLTLTKHGARIQDPSVGTGTITVGAGQTLRFDTIDCTDGVYNDATGKAARTFTNNIVLDGGTLVLAGASDSILTGNISGTGTIQKIGAGTVSLTGTSTVAAGTQIIVTEGVLRVAQSALGSAEILLRGGRLANVANETLDLTGTSFTRTDGNFQIDGGMIVVDTSLSAGAISSFGTGTLRVTGTGTTAIARLAARGTTTVELATEGVPSVGAIVGIDPGATVKLTGTGTDLIAQDACLSGGTLDLNGHSETLTGLTSGSPWSTVLNNGTEAATLTLTDTAAGTFQGSLANGTGALNVVKTGTATWTLPGCITCASCTVEAGTLASQPRNGVVATKIRYTAFDGRTSGSGCNSGIQLDELRVKRSGAQVAWPSGTSAASPCTYQCGNNQGADKMIDGTNNKWYVTKYGIPCKISLGSAISFDTYDLQTGGDCPGRDPTHWVLEFAHLENGADVWYVAAAVNGYTFTESRNAWVNDFAVKDRSPRFGADTVITVAAGAALTLAEDRESLAHLTCAGKLTLDKDSVLTLTGASAVTGSVLGAGTLKLAGTQTEIVADGTATRSCAGGVAGTTALAVRDTATLNLGNESPFSGTVNVSGGTLRTTNARRARYFRFNIVKTETGTTNCQVSELRLTLGGVEVAWPSGTTCTHSVGGNKAGEEPSKIIDGKTGTKFFSNGNVGYFLIVTPSEVAFDGYDWYTAGDDYNRDPISWTFLTSADGTCWQTLDTVSNRACTGSRQTKAYQSPALQPTSITAPYVRFQITQTSGTEMQFSEFDLLLNGAKVSWPSNFRTGYAGAWYNNSEAFWNVTDGNTATKFFYNPFSDAIFTFHSPGGFTFDSYRWYTANDSTQRDPKGWIFSVSWDGITWTTLDTVANRACTTTRKTIAYTSPNLVSFVGALPNDRVVTLADNGTLAVTGAETFGGVSGTGTLTVQGETTLAVTNDAAYTLTGTVNGTGTLTKTGAGTQTLSGAVSLTGVIVVKAGTLNLDNVTLSNVTEIRLEGGSLTGTATCAGNLKVTSAGGANGASIAVGGALTLEGAPSLLPDAGYGTHRTCFTFGSADATTQANFLASTCAVTLPTKYKFKTSIVGSKMILTICPPGTIIYLR